MKATVTHLLSLICYYFAVELLETMYGAEWNKLKFGGINARQCVMSLKFIHKVK